MMDHAGMTIPTLSQQCTETKNTKNYLVNTGWFAVLRNLEIIFVDTEQMSVSRPQLSYAG
jgi:hypothetical protein